MKKGKKTRHLAFDTEDDSKGFCFLWNFYDVDRDKHYTFFNQYDALDFVMSERNTVFWAVNLEYDINNLFRGFFDLLRYTFAGSRMLCAEVIDNEGKNSDRIKFHDTMNHWMMSVQEMGKRLGIEKLEWDHDRNSVIFTRDEWWKTEEGKEFIRYCERDTEIAGKFVHSMLEKYDEMGIPLRMTIASSTLAFFEKKYFKKIHSTLSEETIDFFHEGYYGGRTEIFFNRPIEGSIWYGDINSLYPYCLRDFPYPSIEHFYETEKPNFDLEGMAKVEIVAPKDIQIPYLPARHSGKLIFPVGKFSGVYTYFEIREAIKLGYQVLNVSKAVEFPDRFNPFVDFVNDVYERRLIANKENDELMSITCKALMNFLYGKFAQGNEVIKLVPKRVHELKSGDVIFGDMVLTKKKDEYPRYANCIWSCYTTAYGRHTLYFKGLLPVVKAGGMLLYCDTDSTIYEHGKQILEVSKNLGDFKLEGEYEYAHFKLPKLYYLRAKDKKETYRTKGVPRFEKKNGVIVRNISKEFFETGKATFKKPNKLRETMRRNLSPKNVIKLIPNFWEMRDKSISTTYDKRIVLNTGLTKPIELG